MSTLAHSSSRASLPAAVMTVSLSAPAVAVSASAPVVGPGAVAVSSSVSAVAVSLYAPAVAPSVAAVAAVVAVAAVAAVVSVVAASEGIMEDPSDKMGGSSGRLVYHLSRSLPSTVVPAATAVSSAGDSFAPGTAPVLLYQTTAVAECPS